MDKKTSLGFIIGALIIIIFGVFDIIERYKDIERIGVVIFGVGMAFYFTSKEERSESKMDQVIDSHNHVKEAYQEEE